LFADTSDKAEEKEQTRAASRKKKTGKAPSGKDFSSDLHAFLQEAFEESFQEKINREKPEPTKESKSKSRRQSSSSGLDALIRNTLEPSTMRIDPNSTRRLVVTFKEEQLDKLKTIARQEKTFLKKIIGEIVEGYIQQYEKKQRDKPN